MQKLIKKPSHLAAVALIALVGLGAYAFMKGTGFQNRQANGNAHAARTVATDSADENPLAPDFSMERLNGKTFHLSDHQGKVVVLNFWATWCPPCREEIPDLIDVQNEMEGEVLVVGVSLDKGNPDKVRTFAKEFGINYPIVIDDGTVLEKYSPIHGIPTTFFVSPSGRIPVKASGLLTIEKLRPVLQALIDGESLEEVEPPFRGVTTPFGKKK